MGTREKAKIAAREAFASTIPVLTGFLFLGTAYGILMDAKGYGLVWTFLMSAVAFCGSMQFAAITLLAGVFSPVQALLLSLMVNARHLFYGISMLDRYRGMGKIKPFLIYTLCDETFSIVCSKEPSKAADGKWFYFFISLFDYLYWIAGSVIGSFLGGLVSFDTKGLDFVLTALFVVIFTEQWLESKNHFSALAGIAASAACLVLFGAEGFLIPAMILILVVLTIAGKYREPQKNGLDGQKEEGEL